MFHPRAGINDPHGSLPTWIFNNSDSFFATNPSSSPVTRFPSSFSSCPFRVPIPSPRPREGARLRQLNASLQSCQQDNITLGRMPPLPVINVSSSALKANSWCRLNHSSSRGARSPKGCLASRGLFFSVFTHKFCQGQQHLGSFCSLLASGAQPRCLQSDCLPNFGFVGI